MRVLPDATLPAGLASTYVVGEVLGRGATSTVYEATSIAGQAGALKLIGQPNEALMALEREVLSQGLLAHPNLAKVFATGMASVTPAVGFTFMEQLSGPTLDQVLAAGPLPWREAARLALDVARGLAAMHANAVIHRDVKPGNICDADRGAVLLDFGSLARVGCDVVASGTGTPAYMAPEQAFASQLTPAVDIYALGCVLFEMLCGQVPFAGCGLAVLVNHAHSEFPVDRLAGTAPRALLTLIAACCAKEPARRPSAVAVADALSHCLHARAPARARRRLAAAVTASACVMAMLSLSLLSPTASSAGQADVSGTWFTALVAASAPPRTAFVAGDNLQLTLTATGNRVDLWIVDDDGNAVALTEIVVRVAQGASAALVFNAKAVAPGRWQLTTAAALRNMHVGVYLPDRDASLEALL